MNECIVNIILALNVSVSSFKGIHMNWIKLIWPVHIDNWLKWNKPADVLFPKLIYLNDNSLVAKAGWYSNHRHKVCTVDEIFYAMIDTLKKITTSIYHFFTN